MIDYINDVEEVINEEENKKKFKKENITKLVEFNLGTQSTPSQHDFAHQMASGYIPSQQDEAHRNTSKSSSSNQPMNVDSDPIKRQPEEDHEPKGRAGRPRKDGFKKDRSKTIKDPPRESQEDKIFWDTFGAAMDKKYGKKPATTRCTSTKTKTRTTTRTNARP